MVNNINEELSRCIIKLLLKEPFFAHLLSGIPRIITNQIPTAAVGSNQGIVKLYINENFFLNELKTKSNRIAVIKHETLHLMFKHIFRFNVEKYNSILYNYAADIVVNQFIGDWDLPKNAITVKTFPDLNLKLDQNVEYYYDKLYDLSNKIGLIETSNFKSNLDPKKNNDIFCPKSEKVLSRIYGSSNHSDHSKWGIIKNRPFNSAQHKASEHKLDSLIIQSRDRIPLRDHGSIPGSINDLINIIINKRKPEVDWKRSLRIFSSSSKRTRVAYTMKRISKRYGTRPGIKIKRYQKLALAIDTSGSINNKELSIFFTEIHSMWKQNAEILIIECDAKVHRTYNYKGKFPKFISGKGGTSFDPVFIFLKENRQLQFDGCIYLTDGHASKPKIKPPCKLLWVITSGGTKSNVKYGRSLKLKG